MHADAHLVAKAQSCAGRDVHAVASKVLIYEAGCELLKDRMPKRDRALLERNVRRAEEWLRAFVARERWPRPD